MKIVAFVLGVFASLIGLFILSISLDSIFSGDALPGVEIYLRLAMMTLFGFLPCILGGYIFYWGWTRGQMKGSMIKSYLELLYSFDGRINRRPFWIVTIYSNILLLIILPYLEGDSANSVPGEALGPTMVTILLYAIPAWPIQVKRWHDIDKSGWWIMINLITIIGNVITLFMCGFQKGTEGENRFGDNPLQPDRQESDSEQLRDSTASVS